MKKSIIAIASGIAILAVGTTVLATNSFEKGLFRIDNNGNAKYSIDDGATWNEGTPKGQESSYSLDGGETWNEGMPPADSKDLPVLVRNGTPPADGEAEEHGMMVQNKDGVMSYSTDGGKTWSEEAPAGVETTVDENGAVTTKSSFAE